jgi:hypothetical protein
VKRILAALVFAAPVLAFGQQAAPQLPEDPRAARFRDVERGIFIGFEAGYLGFTETPTDTPSKFPFASPSGGGSAGGIVVGVTVGTDIGNRLSLALFGQGTNQKADANYGAFSLFAGGVDVRLALLGVKDRNDWERFYVYLHGRGGYAQSSPEGLFGSDDVLVQGGPGVEYYTRLRHFSIGLAADYVYATQAKASGFSIYPTVRYTF